jgi:hypothetical protein
MNMNPQVLACAGMLADNSAQCSAQFSSVVFEMTDQSLRNITYAPPQACRLTIQLLNSVLHLKVHENAIQKDTDNFHI